VIGRSQTGDHCQVTLERWLPIDGEPGIEDAVNAIRAILVASARPDPARTIDATHGAVGLSGRCVSVMFRVTPGHQYFSLSVRLEPNAVL